MSSSIGVQLVLGATGGVGRAVTRLLHEAGATLVLAGRSGKDLERLAEEMGADAHVLDARRTDDVADACSQAVERHGRLDGLVNCVGSLLLKPAHRTSDDEWDDTIATNLRSAFATVRAAATTMRKTGGSVVLVSSAAARLGMANHEAIAAAKAGILGLTLSAAATYASYGIRYNAVAPGLVRTPLTEGITRVEAQVKASEAMHPLGRLGTPDDVARAIVWLLDPAQSWLTGQVIGVDGGLATVRSRRA